jgi:hypothetical protein
MEKKEKIIEIGKIYHLDISALTPIKIKTLFFTNNGVMCEFLNSYVGRKEVIDYELFKINGFLIPD